MHQLDEIYTEAPFYGSRRMRAELHRRGYPVGRDRVRKLMQRIGLAAIYPQRKTSIPHPERRIYPYLLRNVPIVRVNQVWSSDITYIRMARGWLYLTVVMDWYSRFILAWELSITLETDFCITALNERLWRTVKYEEVYLHEYQTVPEAKERIARYMNFYNHKRLHQRLDDRPPVEVYYQ